MNNNKNFYAGDLSDSGALGKAVSNQQLGAPNPGPMQANKREPEIEVRLRALHYEADTLAELTERLVARLAGVTAPRSDESDKYTEPENATQMGNELAGIVRRLFVVRRILEKLEQSIEL